MKSLKDSVIEVCQKDEIRVPVIVDRDPALQYETHNRIVRVLRIPLMLLLNLLPPSLAKRIFLIFSCSTSDTQLVVRWAPSFFALEVMYTFPERRAKGKVSISDCFWQYFLSNSRAFRNRLSLVKREILTAIKEVSQRKNEVYLLSLGSGSARAVIEAISLLNNQLPVRIKLIDMSRRAIGYSRKLAESFNLDQGQIEWHRDYAQKLEKYCGWGFQPDIVEMVGLLDYYPYEQAVDLIAKIYTVLSYGGYLITCNICPNLEKPFIEKGIGWHVIYRTPQKLAEIIVEAGFPVEGIKIVYEPLKIYALAICHKN